MNAFYSITHLHRASIEKAKNSSVTRALFRKYILILRALSSVRARLRVQLRINLTTRAAGLSDHILATGRAL